MKFKFSLERILDHKKIQEELAQRDYRIAQQKVFREEDVLQTLYRELDEAWTKIKMLSKKGGTCISDIQSINYFVSGQEKKILNQRSVIRGLKEILDQKQQVLLDATREFKTFERLKEKQLKEFRKLQKKHDNKKVDELVVMRFKVGGTS